MTSSFGDDLRVYLTSLGYTDISLNKVPSDTPNCICIYDTGGFEPVRYHGTNRAIYLDRPTAQIRIRNSAPATAKTNAISIYTSLDGLVSITINGTFYQGLTAIGTPTYMGVDQVTTGGQAHEWALNIHSIKNRS